MTERIVNQILTYQFLQTLSMYRFKKRIISSILDFSFGEEK